MGGRKTSILLFEFISGGGTKNPHEFKFLISEGLGMLSSLITDFSQFGYEIHTLIDARIINHVKSTYSDLISKKQLTITPILHQDSVTSTLENFLPNFDYVMFIAPESSDILYDLVKKAEQCIQSNQILLNLSSHAISMFSDKLKTESFLGSHGFTTPSSYLLESPASFFPPSKGDYIIKPIDGAGAADTYSLQLDPENPVFSTFLADFLQRYPHQQFLIQEKIEGIPLSAFITAQKGKITYFTINSQTISCRPLKSQTNIQQLEYLGGTTPYIRISSEIRNKIKEVASTICSQYQLTGFIGIDFLYEEKSNYYSIVDVNPRVTTPYIAISQLFRENKHNILECLFLGENTVEIKGNKKFQKTSQNLIALK